MPLSFKTKTTKIRHLVIDGKIVCDPGYLKIRLWYANPQRWKEVPREEKCENCILEYGRLK